MASSKRPLGDYLKNSAREWYSDVYLIGASIVLLVSAIRVDAQISLPASDESWTVSSQNLIAHNNPYRTTESHVKSGNRTFDQKVMEVRGTDGQYQPYVRVETETIQESPNLTRSITRTYNPGQDRSEHLTQITEVETRNSVGVSHSEKTISSVDYYGKPQLKEREVTVTTKNGDSQTRQTTVYLPGISGQFAPSMQVNEQQRTGPEGTVAIKTQTLLPDLSGRWQTYEIRDRVIERDDRGRTIDDRVSRRDYDGNVSPVSEVITTERNAGNQFSSTSQTYSVDIPGQARDRDLHPLQSVTSIRTSEPGRVTTEQAIVRPDPGEKDLSTTFKTTDVLVHTSSGTEQRIVVTAQYPDGYPSVVSLETRTSDKPFEQQER